MPTMRTQTIWPTRVSWPRREGGGLPALAGAGPVGAPYVRGRSRFTLSPLHLSLDQLLFLVVTALLAFGLVMVQSADARVRGVTDNWLLWALATKNAGHAGIALLALVLAWRMDYRWLLGREMRRSPALYVMLATLLCLVLVLTPLGKTVNGAKRWLGLGPLSFQPSELAKLGLVLFIGAYAVHRERVLGEFRRGFVPVIAAVGIVALLVVKEDFGTTVLIASVCFVLLLMSGVKWWHLVLLLPPAGAVVYRMLWHSAFRKGRLLAFLDPMADPQGAGYHPMQSLLTIVSGGFWGRGLGNGIQKMGYLPEDNTDFIFSVICEELGFFGALMVLALFVIFVAAGWRIMMRCNNLFGKMVAFGITATIGIQAAINVAVVTVSMPTKGIALPLISSGGTGWIMTAIAVGVLMSIERVNRLEAEAAGRGDGTPATFGFPVVMATDTGNPAAGGGPGTGGGGAAEVKGNGTDARSGEAV